MTPTLARNQTVADFGDDDFLGDCMRLFSEWTSFEEIEEEEEVIVPAPVVRDGRPSLIAVSLPSGWDAVSARLSTSSVFNLFSDRVASLVPSLFSIDSSGEEDEEEVVVEPEVYDGLPSLIARMMLMNQQCYDVSMARKAAKEMDPPSTVSLPSGWDAVSARLSTSSVFNLFSDRVASPVPSLFSIDPTGAPSTVSVPASFWDTASTVSVTGAEPTAPLKKISSTSILWIESCPSLSSSSSSLSLDFSSADSGCPSSLPTNSISSFSLSVCRCPRIEDDEDDVPTTSSVSYPTAMHSVSYPCYLFGCVRCSGEEQSISDDEEIFSGASTSGYETDVDSEPKKMTTVSAAPQTEGVNQSAIARKIAECDSLLEKLAKMKKELRELL